MTDTARDTDQPRWIDYLPLDEILPADWNPKNHHPDIGASLDRFGSVESIAVDERTGKLVAGHGRLDQFALKREAGDPPPDGVTVADDGTWLVPVQRGWASRDDDEARAYLVASNELTTAGGWNTQELEDGLAEMSARSVDLQGLGLQLGTVGSHQVSAHERKDPEPRRPDEVEHRTQPGDIWTMGNGHRLAVGSCTDPEIIGRLLDGVSSPNMTVTDPPYSSGGWQEAGRASGSIGTVRMEDGQRIAGPQIANDRLSTRGYMALMSAMLNACPVPLVYAFTDWRMWVNLFDVMESSGFGVRSMIVWDKGTPGMGRGWRAQHELVMLGTRAVIDFDKHQAVGNVISLPRTGNPLHPTQKPVELLERLIAITPGQVVYDPFAGSGSTLIAAEGQGRACYSVELDPGYADVLLDRWEQAGGATPELHHRP